MNEWNSIIYDDFNTAEWLGEESEEEDEDEEEDEEDMEGEDESSEEEDEADQEIAAPLTPDRSVSDGPEEDLAEEDLYVSSVHVDDPLPRELLREYYLRTSHQWQARAIEWFEIAEDGGFSSVKSLRTDAFQMAQRRFKECQPELEKIRKRLEQEEMEEFTLKEAKKEEPLVQSRHRDR